MIRVDGPAATGITAPAGSGSVAYPRSTMRLELTHKGDYAVRAMIALARSNGEGLLSVPRIAERMAIPPRFLPQVMTDLVRAGLVEARPGRSGGYRLARPADSVTILEIIRAAEGDGRRRACVLRGSPCGSDGHCDVHDVFTRAQDAILAELGQADLASVVRSDVAGSRPPDPGLKPPDPRADATSSG